MRRFQFRLEVIRKLRQRALDAQRRVLAEKMREFNRALARRGELTQETEATVDGQRLAQKPVRLDVELLHHHQVYRAWLDRKAVDTDAELKEQRERVARERATLAEVSRRLNVVEKLRERQWKRHQIQLQRAEQAGYDETALQSFLRRRRDQVSEIRGS